MRIFVANGAARETGHTADLLELFLDGIAGAGAEADLVNLRAVNIAPCRGCYGCWCGLKPGKCVISDDMSGLIERYLESEIAVFASPLYFYSFSARLKMFFERLLPITRPVPCTTSPSGVIHNSLKNPEIGPKSSVLIAVAGQRDPRGLEGIVRTFQLVSGGLSLTPVGALLRNESFFLDFPASRPKTAARIRAAFRRAGAELATVGQISEETQKEAALTLSADQAAFENLTAKYWQTVDELREAQLDREKMRKIFSQNLNMLIPLMATYMNPEAAGIREADFVIDLSGEQPGTWHLRVAEGKCEAASGGTIDRPAMTIKMSSETFLDIIFQRADPRQLIARGALKVTGERHLFKNFAKLFSAQ